MVVKIGDAFRGCSKHPLHRLEDDLITSQRPWSDLDVRVDVTSRNVGGFGGHRWRRRFHGR
jgi:hypothetical protein